jgi:hypothetical protein
MARQRVGCFENGRLAALAALLLSGCGFFARLPSDDTLLKNFSQHEAAFERLLEMSQEDAGFTTISSRYVSPQTKKLPQARWNEYRRLFDALGLEELVRRQIDKEHTGLFLIAGTSGVSVAGSYKGYIHLDSFFEPRPILRSLDGQLSPEADVKGPSGAVDYSEGYRLINDRWYLYRLDD